MVKDIYSGTSSSNPLNLTDVNGTLFFTANEGTNGQELWKSDGTSAGTVLVKDINIGTSSSNPLNLTNVNGTLFFTANEGTNGTELWKSDGTSAGTVLYQDFRPGSSGSSPSKPIVSGLNVYLTATDANGGTQLFVSTIPALLPLRLLQFSGALQNTNAYLEWKTGFEQNTSHFEIERSFDGRGFTGVGTVMASQNSANGAAYAFTDRNMVSPGAAIVYYRLKMVDLDGQFTYSAIVPLRIHGTGALLFLYPNPAANQATLMISVRQPEKALFQLSDFTGRVLETRSLLLTAGSNTIPLDLKGLSAGVYTINIQGSQTHKSVQLIKQ
jgi:ELWxxDGT repeat protein